MALHKVRYRGLSDERIMSQEDLSAAGVDLESGLRWDWTNKHKGLVIEDASERLLELFAMEGTFTVEEITDSGDVEVIKGKALDDTGSVVRDSTSGQVNTSGVDTEQDPNTMNSGDGTETSTGTSTKRGR